MKKILVAVMVTAILLVPSGSANHDPIHAACLQKLQRIDARFHNPVGTWKQVATDMDKRLHESSACYSEPAPPPPPPPIPPPPPPIPPPPPPVPPPPPPPVPQGENLDSLHTWNPGANYYVDATNGNDSTGNGSQGNPWQTPQKAHDELKNTLTWPTDQDVIVNGKGVSKASSAATATIDTSFNVSGRAPSATRFLIWRNWPGSTWTIQNPDGSGGQKGAVRVGTNALNSYQIFYGIEFDGEDVEKGAVGNGNSYGFYLSGGTANSNTQIEILSNEIHGFKVPPGLSNNSAQGITTEGGQSGLKVVGNRIYDIGSASGVTDFQEHGIYYQGNGDAMFLNNVIYNIHNGYNIQFYDSNNVSFNGSIVSHNTLVGSAGGASGTVIHGDSQNISYFNNIIARQSGHAPAAAIELFPNASGSGSNNVVNFNVSFDNDGGNVDEPSATGWTFSNWNTGDPLFVNEGSANFHIQTGSSAIGHTDTRYSPSTDIEGTPRPAGQEDAGAYQFTTEAEPEQDPTSIGGHSARGDAPYSIPWFVPVPFDQVK